MDSIEEQLRVWIFQANPSKYRIHDSLDIESQELWNLNQNAHLVRKGDRVLLWISGNDAGVYALGTVLDYPQLSSDSAKGLQYWIATTEGAKVKPRVCVRYDRVFKDQPLLKSFLLTDPILCELRIIKCPMGTNFKVSEEEWQAFQTWLNSMP